MKLDHQKDYQRILSWYYFLRHFGLIYSVALGNTIHHLVHRKFSESAAK